MGCRAAWKARRQQTNLDMKCLQVPQSPTPWKAKRDTSAPSTDCPVPVSKSTSLSLCRTAPAFPGHRRAGPGCAGGGQSRATLPATLGTAPCPGCPQGWIPASQPAPGQPCPPAPPGAAPGWDGAGGSGLSPVPVCTRPHAPGTIPRAVTTSQSHRRAREKGEQRRGRRSPWQSPRRAQVPGDTQDDRAPGLLGLAWLPL